ncbi:MAG: hypothetical protein ACP5NF_08625 [Thermoanaerobaculum sp.]
MRGSRVLVVVGLVLVAASGFLFHRLERRRWVGDQGGEAAPAVAAARALGFEPGPPASRVYEGPMGILWAWDLATRDSGTPLPPVMVVRFLGGGEVGLRGEVLVRFRRPLPTAPGRTVPATLLPDALVPFLQRAVPDAASFTLEQVASRVEAGVTWHRAILGRGGAPLPEGWRERLEVEVAGSTVISARRTLIPDPDPLGVVLARVAELGQGRWLVLFALGVGVLSLFLAVAESFWFRVRLPWFSALVLASTCALLGWGAGHGTSILLFWSGAALFSVLVVGGLAQAPERGAWLAAPAGVVLAAVSFLVPVIVRALGGWVPFGGPVLTEPWLGVAAEAGFRAVGEEPLLRGGIPWLVRPFLGSTAAYVLAAVAGALLHPVPAVPLPAGVMGEVVAQSGLGWVAARYGWSCAVQTRMVWELVRLGFVAPDFPWGRVWPLALLSGGGILLWRWRRS